MESKHVYQQRGSRFFNPPALVRAKGRRLSSTTLEDDSEANNQFTELIALLNQDEVLMGLFENQAPALVATHVHSPARLDQLKREWFGTPITFFAFPKSHAGFDRPFGGLRVNSCSGSS